MRGSSCLQLIVIKRQQTPRAGEVFGVLRFLCPTMEPKLDPTNINPPLLTFGDPGQSQFYLLFPCKMNGSISPHALVAE